MAYKFNPFTGKLDDYGPILTGTGTVAAAGDGTAALPGIAFASGLNTGIYRPGVGQLAISTGGTGRLFVDASGRVGIGTASPAFPLDVNGSVRLPNSTFLNFNNSSGTAQTVLGLFSDNSTYLDAATGGNIIFRPNASTERARLDSSGRLLVGTSAATNNTRLDQRLALVSTGGAFGGLSNTAYGGTTASVASIFDFQRSRGAADGNMTVVASGDDLGFMAWRGSDGTSFVNAALISAQVDGTPGANDMPGRLVFSTTADGAASPTERMRIKASGIINFSNAPTYADNAAATTGGLVAGDVYRTSTGQLMIRF